MAQQSILSKLRGKLIFGVALGAVVYLAIIIYSDWEKVRTALFAFPWRWFPVIIGLTFANYMFRFLKWDYYLGRLNIGVPKSDSMIIFLSGLVGTITPGKVGELLKALLLKKVNGTPMAKSAPVVVAERLTDFVALVIISLAGITVLAVGDDIWVLVVVIAVLGSFIGVVSHKGLSLWIIGLTGKLPVIGKVEHNIREMYQSTYLILKLVPLSVATFWSVCAWMCECFGFWIVLNALNVPPQLLAASFIYAFGTIVGVVSPGGLGVMDVSMVGMLQLPAFMGENVADDGIAAAGTMIIRIATLWFAVFVGIVVLLIFQKRFEGVSEMLDKAPEELDKNENSANLPDGRQ